jgi:hypothetical protein
MLDVDGVQIGQRCEMKFFNVFSQVKSFSSSGLYVRIPFWQCSSTQNFFLLKLIFKKFQFLSFLIRFNGKTVPENYERILKERTMAYETVQNLQSSVGGKSYGISDLFATTNMARKTTIITFIWFCITSVYVGLSYYAPSLGELKILFQFYF